MSHEVIVLFILAVCGGVLLQDCSFNSTPKVLVPIREHIFPDHFIVGSKVSTTFSIINEGNAPLHIQKIDSDWRVATNTSLDKIPPKEKGEIQVVIKGNEGRFVQNVFVYTNDPVKPMVHLQVSGVILPPITYPKKIVLTQREKGSIIPNTVSLTNNTDGLVKIVSHKVSDSNISVEIPKKNIPAGDIVEIEVTLSLSKPGFYSESLTISAQAQEVLPGTESKEFEISIQFQARVLGGIVVLPQNLFQGVLDESGKSIQKKVQIKTDGVSPFTLEKVSADNFSVTASFSQEPQTAHEVELSITPKTDSPESGLVEGEIQLLTTHPDIPEITISVKAVRP